MLKHLLIFSVLLFSLVFSPFSYAEEAPNKGNDEHHQHKLIDCEKMEELKKEGYSKQDIFMAAMLAKKGDKKIDEVLASYKKHSSWEKTAKELGISTEDYEEIASMQEWRQFVKENRDGVIDYLATYTDKKPEDISGYLNEDISLRFLIGAAVLAKLSDKSLDEMVSDKKEGKSFHDLMDELDIDEDDLHKELDKFKTNMKKEIEKNGS